MGIEERSYGGHSTRPRPEIHTENNGELLIVATPWGPRSAARRAVQVIQDFFLSTRNDMEATSPFKKLTCLSPIANDLRAAVKLANDAIYNEENKNEYISGVELLVIAKSDYEISWVQIGYPYMFLDRKGAALKPLGNSLDLATELSSPNRKDNPPLPQKLLGLESSSDFAVHSMRPFPDDRFVLVSRSHVPKELYQLNAEERDLESISQMFSSSDSHLPFWLGIYSA